MENIENIEQEIQEPIYNAVFYADGACYPNPGGSYGSGVFGYFYPIDTIGKKVSGNKSNVEPTDLGLITDTYKQENYQLLKNNQVVTPSYYLYASKSYGSIGGTNNKAEILAIDTVLDMLLEAKDTIKIREVLIKSDSVVSLTWLTAMLEKSDLNKYNEKIRDILYTMQPKVDTITKDISIKVMHVYGHSSSFGNNIVDRLAFYARIRDTNKEDILVTLKDNITTFPFNPIELPYYLNFKNIYIQYGHNTNIDSPYIVMDYQTGDTIGDKDPDVLMGCIFTNKKDTIVETLASKHLEDEYGILFSLDTKNIKLPNVSYFYNLLKEDSLIKLPRTGNLSVLEETQVMNTVRPAGLVSNLMDKMEHTCELVNMYLGKSKLSNDTKIIDISDKFRTIKTNKKGIKSSDITLGMKDISVKLNIDKLNINLVLGVDLVNRNYLKKFEKYDIKVNLILINYKEYYRYFVLTDFSKDDERILALWANYFSNIVYIKQ